MESSLDLGENKIISVDFTEGYVYLHTNLKMYFLQISDLYLNCTQYYNLYFRIL